MDKDTLETQAAIFGHYLLGRPVAERAVQLYIASVTAGAPAYVSKQEQATLTFAFRHRWALGLLDAGLSFIRPNAELRRRLFILFSILESLPEYSGFFLPQARSKWYLLTVLFTGCKASVKLVLGTLLVKVVAW